ncbi:MAG TPA: glycosyltransferase family 39 protein [Candidatus Eisenbacteria bacterium]|nr:glycosyltransferase family 39 protein [Candidatus Eisenbacteria bacterium]
MKRLPAVLAAAALAGLLCLGLGGPWKSGNHSGSAGAFFSVVARNYLRYGGATRLGQVLNTGAASPAEFDYYTHHPPLTAFLVTSGFLVFGEHEWAARLPFLLCSLAFLAALFLFARDLYDARTARIACAAAVLMPAFTAYRSLVCVLAPLLCFSMWTLYFYRKWRRRRSAGPLAASLFFYFLALESYQMAVFLLVPIALDALRDAADRPPRRPLLLFPLVAAGSIALLLLHNLWLTGSPFGGGLVRQFFFRVGLVRGTSWDFTAGQWLVLSAERFFWLFTAGGIFLAGLWAAGCRARRKAGEREEGDLWIASLLFFGLAPNVFFLNLSYVHAFFQGTLVPFFSLAAARAAAGWRGRRRLLVCLAAAAALQSGVALARLSANDADVSFSDPEPQRAVEIADRVRRLTGPADRVAASCDVMVVRYYADRAFDGGILTLARFEEIRRSRRPMYFLHHDQAEIDPALRSFLEKTPVDSRFGRYTLYTLRQEPMI